MEEIKLDEVFQVGRTKLKCIESNDGCEGCFFADANLTMCEFLSQCGIECDLIYRKDRTPVIFVKVEE